MWDLAIPPPFGAQRVCSPPQLMWDLTIRHLQGPTSSLALVTLQSTWDLTIYSSSAPNVLAGTPPSRPNILGSDTICNSQSPPLGDIVFFRLSLNISKTRILWRDFHTLINNVSFSSPTNTRSHIKGRRNWISLGKRS